MCKTVIFYFYLLLLVALGSCGNADADETAAPADSTGGIYDNESYDVDTVKNKHIIYDNP